MSLYIPNYPTSAEASDPSYLVVKEGSLRDQMLRDLEQFLSFQLTNPKAVSLRLARKSRYGGKLATGGSVASE
ncbi:MAG TPA: hypothetical protein VK797_06740 [Tepidisphaeraceae bacterium]|jgi:hypothetical protein|nr:hypothetical protein [Tepidisphaeraceae bacterium]